MHDHATRLRDWINISLRSLGGIVLAGGLAMIDAGTAQSEYLYLATSRPYVVTADRGGYLAKRSDEITHLRAAGRRVEVRGTCLSACTMYLSLPNLCVTPDAVFGFHGPSQNGTPLPQRDFDYWSMVMAANYNEPLRTWFMKKARFNTSGYYQVSGAKLIELGYKRC